MFDREVTLDLDDRITIKQALRQRQEECLDRYQSCMSLVRHHDGGKESDIDMLRCANNWVLRHNRAMVALAKVEEL